MTTASKQMQFITTPDNIQLYLTGWLVDDARAAVLLVHGVGEHSGRYGHVISALNARGYSVFAYDQRGHGKSGGRRVWFEAPDALPNDLYRVREAISDDAFGLPLFVYGHSMGALVALAHALDNQEAFAGVIVSGSPFSYDRRVPPAVVAINTVLARVVPRAPTVALVNPNDLSRDRAVVKRYSDDPLNFHGRVPARSGTNLLELLHRTRPRLPELKLPVLILHGEADSICPPSGSQLVYDQVASSDKTLTLYPGLFHEIHNEPEQVTVIRDILAWLDAQITTPPG